MPKIIVSYRRSDTQAIAGRIYDRLSAHYGDESVFMDIDKIPVGTDFRQYIRNELRQANVMLAIIGPRWLGPRDDGRNRISERADPVRVEIETALEGGLPIVPVLVDGAHMPAEEELPDTLKDFAFINAAVVDIGRDFRQHMDRLIRAMDGILARAKAPKPEPKPLPPRTEPKPAPALDAEPAPRSVPAQETVSARVGAPPPRPMSPPTAAPLPAGVAGALPPSDEHMERPPEPRRLAPAALGLLALLAVGVGTGGLYWLSGDKQAAPPKTAAAPAAPPQAPSGSGMPPPSARPADPAPPLNAPASQRINTANISSVAWKLQNTLPTSMQATLQGLTQRVDNLSNGRMRVEAFPAGTIVPASQVLDAVSAGAIEMGYATGQSGYSKHRALTLMTAIPFAFNPRDQLAFRRRPEVRAAFDGLLNDGLKLNVVALPCGGLGRIGELWVKRPLKGKSDLTRLKLRVLGLSSDIYKAIGSTVVALPLGEVYAATEKGVIDGGQYLTPKSDLDFGFARLMKNYFYPSLTQPAYVLDLYVNKAKWTALSPDGREVIETACREAADEMLVEQTRIDAAAMVELGKAGVTVSDVPRDIEQGLQAASETVLAEQRRDLYFDRIMRLAEPPRTKKGL
jgi:TRAP-type mannitol/chloroaromatic compound transport system substrate-binding protein